MSVIFTWILGVCCAFGGEPVEVPSPTEKDGKEINLKDLPGVDGPFKVAPYVRVAALLQEMGEVKACKKLAKLAERGDDGQVAILCRMLFSPTAKTTFRSPFFGGPVYLGGTGDDDWPLSPIELVDGVPFFVVEVFHLGGQTEPSSNYLKVSIENCEWSKTRFDQVSEKTIENSLKKLLSSKKWKTPLTDAERRFFSSQTK